MDATSDTSMVLRTIFFNPFCTKKFIISSTGLSYYKVSTVIQNTRGVVKETATVYSPRRYQDVYFLDDKAQRESVGISWHPVDMCYAYGMTFARLQKLRSNTYKTLSTVQPIAWMISPWKLDHKGIYLDGLLCIKESGENGYLQGIAIASEAPSTNWYSTVLEALQKWRQYNQKTIPFEMVFYDAPDGQSIHKAASKIDIGENASIKTVKAGIIETVRTSTMKPVPTIKLKAEEFLAFTRTQHRPGYKMGMTPMEWCEKEYPEIGAAATIRGKVTWLQIRQILSVINRPGLTAKQQRQLLDPEYKRHDFMSDIRKLVKWNAVSRLSTTKGLFVTDLGLEVLAIIYGTASAFLREYYGNPPTGEREMFFLRYHHALIAKVMLAWQQAGIVSTWQSTAQEYKFELPEEIANRAKERKVITIDPDIVGSLNLGGTKKAIWIEIDRGSKFSNDMHRQITKYVLAGISYQRTHLPVTLWIISDRRRFNSARVKRIIEYTQKAYNEYPASSTIMAFTHVDILNRIKASDMPTADNWTMLTSSITEPLSASLEQILSIRTPVTSPE